jgi:3-oxoacyl-(acyl-carrier-protein) synthase
VTPRLVTGIGVVSPIGIGQAAFFDAFRTGARARGRPETFDASRYAAHGEAIVAEVRGFDAAKFLGDKGLRTLDRLTKLMVVAARLALEDAGLKKGGAWASPPASPPPPGAAGASWAERVGIVVSNAYGSIEAITELDRVSVLEDPRYINPARFPLTVSNSAAGYVSIWEDLRALNVSVSDGNCGALDAVTCADLLLAGRRADVLLVGGAEAMTDGLYAAFSRLGGPVAGGRQTRADGRAPLGEGAALLVVETQQSARARGANAVAEIVGYGTAFAPPAHEGALVRASTDAIERAIAEALEDARVDRSAIDAVVSGVSANGPFDEAELDAIGRAVGADACVIAPKSAWGETLGAGGALAMLAAIGCLRDDAESYIIRGALRRPARTALVVSVGYYGNASAVVLRAPTRRG